MYFCYVMLCNVMIWYLMLCYVCYAMLCYAMLCCAMLCYVILCYVMSCYVMLCYVMLMPFSPSKMYMTYNKLCYHCIYLWLIWVKIFFLFLQQGENGTAEPLLKTLRKPSNLQLELGMLLRPLLSQWDSHDGILFIKGLGNSSISLHLIVDALCWG